MFFYSCPSFLDEPREETLATQPNPSQDSGVQCTPPRRDNFFRVQAVADPKPSDNRGVGHLGPSPGSTTVK